MVPYVTYIDVPALEGQVDVLFEDDLVSGVGLHPTKVSSPLPLPSSLGGERFRTW